MHNGKEINMSIHAFKCPDGIESVNFIAESIEKGVSRFGWSYIETSDLNLLEKKEWNEMTEDEINCYNATNFLWEIEKGDWIVHINVPKWGMCTAVEVIGGYSFGNNNEFGDFRHQISIDQKSIITFDRNDVNVLPEVSKRLKLQGKRWHIYCETEFFESIDNLKRKSVSLKGDENKGIHYLRKNMNASFEDITASIHKNHPGKMLEKLMADVFWKVPNVINVKENGSGWGTDYGADLIVTYKTGLPISSLEIEEILVVQIKSYEGEHWDTNAIKQIETAMNKYNASSGLLITTAKKTDAIDKEIEKTSKDGKPIAIIAGNDVAKFVLKFGHELLFDV